MTTPESSPMQVLPFDDAPPPAVPPTPRPLTSRVRQQSWLHMSVRVWLLLALAVLMVDAYFTVTRVVEAMKDRDLIERGLLVDAKLYSINGMTTPKRWPRSEAMAAVFQFTMPDGRPVQLDVRLEPKPMSQAPVGQTMPIRVDPKDPQRWTEETEPKPWTAELTATWLLTPAAVVLLVVAVLCRRRLLHVWRTAPLVNSVVVDTRHSSMAPRSRIVRFTVEQTGNRIWTTHVPTIAGVPQPGNPLWLICSPTHPSPALPAVVYAG